MRIISGSFGGRLLHPPKNLPVRPTTDFARTALFNILQHRYDLKQISVIDLFAGTGAVSIEFISRGCKDVTTVDKNPNCIKFIQETIKSWGVKNIRLIKDDVFRFIAQCNFSVDVIFADPPYDLENIDDIPLRIFEKNILKNNGLLIVEHGDKTDLSKIEHFIETRRYGNVNFSLFSNS